MNPICWIGQVPKFGDQVFGKWSGWAPDLPCIFFRDADVWVQAKLGKLSVARPWCGGNRYLIMGALSSMP